MTKEVSEQLGWVNCLPFWFTVSKYKIFFLKNQPNELINIHNQKPLFKLAWSNIKHKF